MIRKTFYRQNDTFLQSLCDENTYIFFSLSSTFNKNHVQRNPLLDILSLFLLLMGGFYARRNMIETLVSMKIKCIANKRKHHQVNEQKNTTF